MATRQLPGPIHRYQLGEFVVGINYVNTRPGEWTSVIVEGPKIWIGRNAGVVLAGYRDATGRDAEYLAP